MSTSNAPLLAVFVQGLVLGLSLIVAIGAQNAFVLRQGLRREQVGSIVLFCAVSDALLIGAGVLGMAQALGDRPWLARILALAGAAFLAVYGMRALRRARTPQALHAMADGSGLSRSAALAQAAAFTLLNPHVYLDTVLLSGLVQRPGIWREPARLAGAGRPDRPDDVAARSAAGAARLARRLSVQAPAADGVVTPMPASPRSSSATTSSANAA